MYPFSEIIQVPGHVIHHSPAKVNHKTKRVFVNADLWAKLNDDTQRFILYHEAGHIVLNTRDEHSADAYAFQRMVAEGRSLKACVYGLTKLLTNSVGHRKRAYLILQMAKAKDLITNKN